jgi:hypothetical protein
LYLNALGSPLFAASNTSGVGQPASIATSDNGLAFCPCKLLLPLFQSRAAQVGHPVEPLPDVRSADARSAQIGSCPVIGHSFQVSEYSGEPIPASLACNLLAKHDWRLAGSDEFCKHGPEVSFVLDSFAFSGDGKRLAGA